MGLVVKRVCRFHPWHHKTKRKEVKFCEVGHKTWHPFSGGYGRDYFEGSVLTLFLLRAAWQGPRKLVCVKASELWCRYNFLTSHFPGNWSNLGGMSQQFDMDRVFWKGWRGPSSGQKKIQLEATWLIYSCVLNDRWGGSGVMALGDSLCSRTAGQEAKGWGCYSRDHVPFLGGSWRILWSFLNI